MNSFIQGSCIPVALPTALYVSLVDYLSRSKTNCHEPSAAVATIVRKYLDDAQTNPPGCSGAPSAPVRTNDSMTFGAPPSLTKDKALKPAPQSRQRHRNDWCIGCGCPAEELIS